jgi:hypothetical protein
VLLTPRTGGRREDGLMSFEQFATMLGELDTDTAG